MIPNDPVMLTSYINLKLRDEGITLDEFCEKYDEDKETIVSKLKAAGFSYNSDTNQVR